jgi:non-homologous end joining protein Ku
VGLGWPGRDHAGDAEELVVDKDNKIRGYKISKGKFVEIEPEEIKAIQVESTHTLDIDKFVPIDEIDRRYFDRSCPKERPARKRSPSFVTP